MFGRGSDGNGDGHDRTAVVADLRRRLDRIGGGVGWSGSAGAGVAGDGASAGGVDGMGGGRSSAVPEVLAVPTPLAAVLPREGIPQGSVVSLGSTAPGGSGTTSLLLSLLAAPPGAWAAVVGMPGLGVLAAAEMGVDLDHLGLIPDPGPDVLQVLSVLADGLDVIATVPPATLPPARQRVLTGRLRERGAVLLVMGCWPGADLTMTVTDVRWSGIGQGHGRLRDREIDVRVGGRRAGAGASATLLLRSTRTTVTVEAATPAGPTAAGDPTPSWRRPVEPPAVASAGTG